MKNEEKQNLQIEMTNDFFQGIHFLIRKNDFGINHQMKNKKKSKINKKQKISIFR